MLRHHTYNHLFLLRICASFMMIIFAGCQKSPINGDLDGQWQVMEVTPNAPETIVSVRLYMCFSLHTVQLSYYGTGVWASGNILRFEDKTLSLDFPYETSESSIALLKQYGIYSNPVTFTVEHLDKNKLILRDGDTVVTLRKF